MPRFLTDEKRQVLKSMHRAERDKRVCDRIKAVLLSDDGWTYRDIAKALLLDEETVSQQVAEFQASEKLKPQNGGSASHLSAAQTEAVITHLERQTYTKVKDICAFVLEYHGVAYTVQGMTDWLHAHAFSYKQPKEVPAKADPQKQAEFLEAYEDLKANTPENEPILFMDAVHPTMATKVTCGWIRTGKDKTIETTASRTRVNIIGAMCLATLRVLHQAFETINGESIMDFLASVRKAHPDAPKMHLILDQAGYHTSDVVMARAKDLRIELHHLPSYSPNLNLIERLWKVMNEEVRNNRFFKSAKDFRDSLEGFFTDIWPRLIPAMRSRMNDDFRIVQKSVA